MWDAFKDYLAHLESDKSASEATVTKRERGLAKFAEWCENGDLSDLRKVGNVDNANDVQRRHISGFVDYLVEEGYSFNTIMKSHYPSVGAALRYLYREDMIEESVMERVDRKSMKKKARSAMSTAEKKAEGGPPPHLSKEEVYQLADNVPAPADRNELLVKLMFWTGTRSSEVVMIELDDIDYDGPSIVIYSPKTDKTRPVSYPAPEINPLLRDWIHNGRLRYKDADSSDRLFLGNKGPLTAGHVNDIVQAAAEACGLQQAARTSKDGRTFNETRSHILRHSHAMYYLNEEDAPIERISQHLGHSSVSVTEEFYAQSTEETIIDEFS